jgi:hypothetical protein
LQTGIDYRELAESLKPLFLESARARLLGSDTKATDSALSLLTGLHRKEIRQAREGVTGEGLRHAALTPADASAPEKTSTGVPAQLVARWLHQDLPRRLPWQGDAHSFQSLAQSISRDTHPKALLNTLQLQGVVSVDPEDGTVQLLHDSYTPAGQAQAMLDLLSQSVADHMQAGLRNLNLPAERRHLEQSVFADGLTARSADHLERLATQLWRKTLKTLLAEATTLSEQDQGKGGDWRFRVGMYSFSTDRNPASSAATDKPISS